MSREPISEDIKRRLYAESMGRCMNPNCRKSLFGNKGDIIEKAHIEPYCKTANNSFENLVILCPNCHTEFDKNEAFKPEEVREWKQIRSQEVERFFGIHYNTFEELAKIVVPILMENKTLFELYYLGNKKNLWDRIEPTILINNRKLKSIFWNNLSLFQDYKNKSYSNLEIVISFIKHIDEFEKTRTDKEKVRGILFPSEINSLFGIAPIHDSLLSSTESLEAYIRSLRKQNCFKQIVLGIDNPYIETVKNGKKEIIYLDDSPRIRQEIFNNKCPRKTYVHFGSLNFALKYIKRRGLSFSFPDENNLRIIQVEGNRIVFVYDYCLTKVRVIQLCPDEGEVIVNLHDWNGESCISHEAYVEAAKWGTKLLRMDEFYTFIRKIEKQ